jgi:hypothetical protein
MLHPSRPHSQYQQFVLEHVPSVRQFLWLPTIELMAMILCLDLTPVAIFIRHTYSIAGRPATDPCDLFRALLLMTFLQIKSLDDWADLLRQNPVYAIISGFVPGQTPGATTFRDLEDRLWNYMGRHGRKKHRKQLRLPYKKPTKKLKPGEKAPPRHPDIVAKISALLLKGWRARVRNEDIMNQIIKQCAIIPSAQLGLLGDTQQLILSGDGSHYESGANPFGRKVCNCRKEGIFKCDCARRFPDPDASWGWDSYRAKYVYGYTAYELTAVGGVYDLPCYVLFASCQRHDSVSGLFTLDRFYQMYPEFHLRHYLGDSAHDAMAFYQYLRHHGTWPIIALNSRSKNNNVVDGDMVIDKSGRPICPKGLPMLFSGACPGRNRIKWICPLAQRGKHIPDCACTTAAYGRTFYTDIEKNPRLHTNPPRGSVEFKALMAKRSGSERSNSRKKTDLGLMRTRIRCFHRRAIQVGMAAIVQHLKAWLKEGLLGRGPVTGMLRHLMQFEQTVA